MKVAATAVFKLMLHIELQTKRLVWRDCRCQVSALGQHLLVCVGTPGAPFGKGGTFQIINNPIHIL